MRRILALSLAAALGGAILAPTASGQVTETGTYGAWTSLEGRSDRGRRMCAIYARGRDRSFYIKYFENDTTFVIQVYKASWEVSRQTPVQVRLQLGSGYLSNVLNASAYPRQAGSDPVVEVSLRFEGSQDFWTALRTASQGRLEFLTGNEGSWTINLDGSNAAVGAMQACIRRMGGTTTQPFDGAPRTQPFEATPRTQPFDGGQAQGSGKGAVAVPAPTTGATPKFP